MDDGHGTPALAPAPDPALLLTDGTPLPGCPFRLFLPDPGSRGLRVLEYDHEVSTPAGPRLVPIRIREGSPPFAQVLALMGLYADSLNGVGSPVVPGDVSGAGDESPAEPSPAASPGRGTSTCRSTVSSAMTSCRTASRS